jgi:hypothetical protein
VTYVIGRIEQLTRTAPAPPWRDEEVRQREIAKQRLLDAASDRLKAYAVWEHRATPVFDEMRAAEGFWYIMTPYTKYPAGMQAAFNDATRVTASFSSIRLNVYTPIVHGHPQALVAKLPTDHHFWWSMNLPFMQASCGALVVELEGWRESDGINAEIEWYAQQGKRVLYLPCPPLTIL